MSARELKEIYRGKLVLLEDEKIEEGKVVKPMLIGGVATQGNVGNENKRYYRTKLWERECDKKQELIKIGKLLGELDHPDDGKSRLEKTDVRYTKLEMDGDYMNFEAVVLDTPSGDILKGLLRGGVGVDISTRGFGSTKNEKIDGKEWEVVQDDYDMVGIDQVVGHSSLSAEIQYYQEKANKGGINMDLEQLKKEHPDLVEAIAKETEKRVTKEVTEKLTTEFEERILDEISKSRDEIVTEVTAEVKASMVPQYEEHENMLSEIAEIVKDFVGEGEEGEPGTKDEKVVELEQKLDESNKASEQMRKDLDNAQEKIAKSDVREYLEDVLKNEPFKKILKERLSDCESREDVDKRLETEKDFVNKVIQENKVPKGKGEQDDKDKSDKDLTEQQDSDKKRQQRLAGVA